MNVENQVHISAVQKKIKIIEALKKIALGKKSPNRFSVRITRRTHCLRVPILEMCVFVLGTTAFLFFFSSAEAGLLQPRR